MNASIQSRLRDFTTTLLERRSALVEWPAGADEGWGMLPPELAARLGGSELLRLSHKPESGGLSVNLGTDFLDRMLPLLQAEPRLVHVQINEAYLKKSDMEEPVARAFSWLNAKVRVKAARPERIEYHAWNFSAALKSDEAWEDLIAVTLNSASLAEVALPEPAGLNDLSAAGAVQPFNDSQMAAALRVAAHVEQRAGAFITRLESRLQRDRKRLRDYYHALLSDSKGTKTPEAKSSEAPEKQRAAVDLELRRKTLELEERYKMEIRFTPLTLTRIEMPVLAVDCEVQRKQARRVQTLYWNPVLSALEPIACSNCGAPVFAVAFTDNDVAARCNACL